MVSWQNRAVGYARAAFGSPSLDEQVAALRAAGCLEDNIWVEPDHRRFRYLEMALLDARKGDVFLVTRLGCLSNSFARFTAVLERLQSSNVQLRLLDERLGATLDNCHLIVPAMLDVLKAWRDARSYATRWGLEAARQKGRHGGRPPALSPEAFAYAQDMLADPRLTLSVIADRLGVSRSTLHKAELKRSARKK